MHEALITIARMIALAHDHWRATIGRRRPHYRRNERLEILWHAARYRLSIADTAAAFHDGDPRLPVLRFRDAA